MKTSTRIYIALAVGAVVIACLSLGAMRSSYTINRLTRETETARAAARVIERRAAERENEAAAYREKIQYLEDHLKEIQTLARKQDEELKTISINNSRARGDVERARRTRSVTATAQELCPPSSPSSGTGVKSEPPASAGGQRAADETLPEKRAAFPVGSGPPAYAGGSDMISACMGTAIELENTRVLVTSLENENRALGERLETEKRTTTILAELNNTRKGETEALRATVAAKNETITAKDVVIASQDKLVEAMKKKKPSPWRRLGDILIGAAAAIILR